MAAGPPQLLRIVMRAFLPALLLPLAAAAQPEPPAAPPPDVYPAVSQPQAAVLGVVEGLTEFLPVSSTGHLLLANRFLGLDDPAPVLDARGQPILHGSAQEVLTVEQAAESFIVLIQVGGIAAVVLLYWNQLVRMLLGLLGRDREGLLLLRNVLVAFLPAAVIGLAFHDWIEATLFSVEAVLLALVVGAVIMLAVERWRRRSGRTDGPEPWQLSPRQALIVGFAQCIALWPGMSRSMATIVGGYIAGLAPRKAAEFSFLVGLPTLAGASLLVALKTGPAFVASSGWVALGVGLVVSFAAAALAARWLVSWLTSHGLAVFAWYRILLASALVVLWYR